MQEKSNFIANDLSYVYLALTHQINMVLGLVSK